MRKVDFTKVVLRQAKQHLPGYRHTHTTKGSGPVVYLVNDPRADLPRLHAELSFAKALRGGMDFSVDVACVFTGPIKGGKDGEFRLTWGALGATFRATKFASAADLELWFEAYGEQLRCEVDSHFEFVAKDYAALDRLLGRLVTHYAVWYEKAGANEPPQAFVLPRDEDLARRRPPEEEVPAFGLFIRDLKERGLLFESPILGLQTALWRFWHQQRPMKRREYLKGDYHYCAAEGCTNFAAQGTQLDREDPVFGTYTEFICGRHAKP